MNLQSVTKGLIECLHGVRRWHDLETQLASLPTEKQRGDYFELFVKGFLLHSPEYQFTDVWLAHEAPRSVMQTLGQEGRDIGIDLVGRTTENALWAIQAKFRSNRKDVISYRELATALATSDRADYRLIITNTEAVASAVNDRLKVGLALVNRLDALEESFFHDLSSFLSTHSTTIATPPKKTPFPYQQAIIDNAKEYFAKHKRGKLIMPPGTGKTLVSLWINNALEARSTLILVPSLALMRQTVREWLANASQPFWYRCVASDSTVAGDKKEDVAISHTWELDIPVTTEAAKLIEFLRATHDEPKVVFATYQSGAVIVEAMKSIERPFDLAIYDEAHRTAGVGAGLFNLTLHDHNLPASRRLFLTATPKLYAKHIQQKGIEEDVFVFSMDNTTMFGEEIYRMNFRDAIQLECLSDYKIVVIAVTDQEVYDASSKDQLVELESTPGAQEYAVLLANKIALLKAMRQFGIRHLISFHGSVKRAQEFILPNGYDINANFAEVVGLPAGNFKTSHVNGTMTTADRDSKLQEVLESPYGLITNARCLTEGVDVPAVDCVYFVDPKYSRIDIIQAVGRALRRHPQKTFGYVVVPILIPPSATGVDDVVNSSQFESVWNVIAAMQSQDERLDELLSHIRVLEGHNAHPENHTLEFHRQLADLAGRIQFVDVPRKLQGSRFEEALHLKIVESRTSPWDASFGALLVYRKERPDSWPRLGYVDADGFPLGDWCRTQRGAQQAGELSQDRIKQLNSIGFPWNVNDNSWSLGLDRIKEYQNDHPNSWPKVSYRSPDGFMLGAWCNNQRQRKMKGKLPPSRIAILDALGFVWRQTKPRTPSRSWDEAYKELVEYLNIHNNQWPEQNARTAEGFNIEAWCTRQRTNWNKGRLSPDQIKLLDQLRFPWDLSDSYWNRGYEELRLYREKYADSWPPQGFVTETGFKLTVFCDAQRNNRRSGKLTVEQVSKLDGLGFQWNPSIDAWMKRYQLLKDFRTEQPGEWPKWNTPLRDGVNLHSMVRNLVRRAQLNTLSEEQLAKLNSLGFGELLESSKDEWNSFHNLLLEYRRTHPDTWPSNDYVTETGVYLGSWCLKQRSRRQSRQLHHYYVERLDAIGFPWDLDEEEWKQGYRALLEYRNCHSGALPPLDHTTSTGFQLGQWCAKQEGRARSNLLNREQVAQLKEMGFFVAGRDDSWLPGYNALKQYRASHRDTWPKATYVDETGFALGNWCTIQRSKKRDNKLAQYQEEMLNDLGFLWGFISRPWLDAYEMLVEYRRNHPDEWPERGYITASGYTLGNWCARQRQKLRKGALQQECVQMLASLEFEFDN